jgi:predicted transcriptional regulator
MIEDLKKLIEENNFNGFEKVFSSTVTNSHHRELLYELSYRKQQEDFYIFLENKVNLNQEKRRDIFLKTLSEDIKIKDYETVRKIPDSVFLKISQNMQKN